MRAFTNLAAATVDGGRLAMATWARRDESDLFGVPFAAAVGVDGGGDEVGRWERGEQQPDAGTLAKIATMGVVDVLVFHDDVASDDVAWIRHVSSTRTGACCERVDFF